MKTATGISVRRMVSHLLNTTGYSLSKETIAQVVLPLQEQGHFMLTTITKPDSSVAFSALVVTLPYESSKIALKSRQLWLYIFGHPLLDLLLAKM